MGESNNHSPAGWRTHLTQTLGLFGHRNWIVVADSAYPAQSNGGIETVIADATQIEVVETVLKAIAASGHVKALVHLDRELEVVEEADAPGVEEYRRRLDGSLEGLEIDRIPHEEIIGRLDRAAAVFSCLVLKTSMAIPYTSVFFELDCRYWSAAAEQALRRKMRTLAHNSIGP